MRYSHESDAAMSSSTQHSKCAACNVVAVSFPAMLTAGAAAAEDLAVAAMERVAALEQELAPIPMPLSGAELYAAAAAATAYLNQWQHDMPSQPEPNNT